MQVADLTDQGYLENGQVIIGDDGFPVLKRHKAKDMSSGARALETAILDRLRERSVIEILCDVAHWTGWRDISARCRAPTPRSISPPSATC